VVSIVVVEDEKDVLSLLCDVLESDGFDVIGLGRPDQVQQMAPPPHPDMFLLDLMLPGMNGIDLARRLRDSGYSQEPIIGMSASPRMLDAASRSGLFQETISKPFDLSILLDTVERFAS
jgi:DNA-binding response OmpR family regulator